MLQHCLMCFFFFSVTDVPQSSRELRHVHMAQQAIPVYGCCAGLRTLVLIEGGTEEGDCPLAAQLQLSERHPAFRVDVLNVSPCVLIEKARRWRRPAGQQTHAGRRLLWKRNCTLCVRSQSLLRVTDWNSKSKNIVHCRLKPPH